MSFSLIRPTRTDENNGRVLFGIRALIPAKLLGGTGSLALATFLLFCWAVCPAEPVKPATRQAATPESRTAQALERAAKQGPAALEPFLRSMPKGTDLHSHLGGAIYAESYIRAAGEDGLCIDTSTMSFVKPVAETRSLPPQPVCGEGRVRADSAPKNQHLYDQLIDAFSMRAFVPAAGNSGHDHFFDSFGKFQGTSHAHLGEWIDEVAERAAAQNEQYLELMHTPEWNEAAAIAEKIGFNPDFKQYRQQLLDAGLRSEIPAIRKDLDDAEAKRHELEHCGQSDAKPACQVTVRYLAQVLRGLPREVVFAQILLSFELASADPRVVGLNLVMPEDGYVSMTDYPLHMQMLDVLHSLYPNVHITLHAGELTMGLVPPEGLRFHIRSAVEQGHAERIGHGVDVMYEDRGPELLKEMAARHVMVEINLTSNAVILNVKGNDHPLQIYREYGVPVALSTDDEGVARIDLTHEYVRAVDTYHFTYPELKQMVRTGLEHAFLPGESLWQRTAGRETFSEPVRACAGQLGRDTPTGACATFVKASEKAQQQWELERRFRVFEAQY